VLKRTGWPCEAVGEAVEARVTSANYPSLGKVESPMEISSTSRDGDVVLAHR